MDTQTQMHGTRCEDGGMPGGAGQAWVAGHVVATGGGVPVGVGQSEEKALETDKGCGELVGAGRPGRGGTTSGEGEKAEPSRAACRALMGATDAAPGVGCVIMASGRATRFGSNKLMAELAGKPLVQHVIEASEGLFARRVVVTRHPEVACLSETLGVEAVLHDEPGRDDTVRLGMQPLQECGAVMFLQADQPLISSRTIAALLAASHAEAGCIWRASFEGTPGAPVLFPAWARRELCELPAGKGGGFVVKAHPELVRYVEAASRWELFDVDTVDDLRILQEHLAQEG